MPTYDYQCDACNHTFEEFQSMMDKHLKKCPKCGKRRLRRLLGTGAAIIFKGSGFYQTDYRSEGYKNAAKADEAKPADAKPATDSTAKTTDAAVNSGKTDKPAASSSPKKDKSSS